VHCCHVNPILAALEANKLYLAKYLLKKGADANWRSSEQLSAVHIAVSLNNAELLKQVLAWPRLESLEYEFTD